MDKDKENIAAMYITDITGNTVQMVDINTGNLYEVDTDGATSALLEPEVIVAFDLNQGVFLNETDDSFMWG